MAICEIETWLEWQSAAIRLRASSHGLAPSNRKLLRCDSLCCSPSRSDGEILGQFQALPFGLPWAALLCSLLLADDGLQTKERRSNIFACQRQSVEAIIVDRFEGRFRRGRCCLRSRLPSLLKPTSPGSPRFALFLAFTLHPLPFPPPSRPLRFSHFRSYCLPRSWAAAAAAPAPHPLHLPPRSSSSGFSCPARLVTPTHPWSSSSSASQPVLD